MRTPDVTTALGYVRNGVEGSCLVDYRHKATISWTIDILAAEVERLEASAQTQCTNDGGDWVPGMKCTKCHGTGEGEDVRTCSACAGTGDVWMTWKQRAETAETRVSWLEQQREEECKQKLAALAESEVCLKETRGFKERAFRAEARVKELEIVRDALIRSEESAQQLEELVSNQAQEYIERAEAAEQRADESERAFGLLEEAHKSTTEKFASMMARVAELEELCNAEDKRMEACDWFHQYREACIKIADMHDELEAVKAQNARLRGALTRISESNHARWNHFAVKLKKIAREALADGKGAPDDLQDTRDARLREALEFLLIGYEGLGGDMHNNAPQMAKAALAETKGTP